MTKLFVTKNGDTATIGYETGRLNKDVEFEVSIRFPDNPTLDISKVYPAYAIGESKLFRFIKNNRFTAPKGNTKFFIQLQFNNIPNSYDDARIEIIVKVITTGTNISNTSGLKVTIDSIDDLPVSNMVVDAVEEVIAEGRTDAYANYTLSYPLIEDSPIKVNYTVTSGQIADAVGNLRYSFNGVSKTTLPPNGEITLPKGSTQMFVYFDAKTNSKMLDDLDFKVWITKITNTRLLILGNVTKTFHIKDATILPAGTYIKQICKGKDAWGVYSDGSGGTYEELIQVNSTACGYKPPAAGTILEEYCAGVHRMVKKADGLGGYYVDVKQSNSIECGYVPRVPNNQDQLTPTTWDAKSGTTQLSTDKLDFYALNRDGTKSAYGALFGKWYWEVTVSFPTATSNPIAIGLATSNHSLSNWIGSGNQSWGWWIYQSTFYHNNIDKPYGVPIQDGDVISVIYDAELNTLEFWLNGVSLGISTNTLPANVKLYAVVNATNESYASANFGQWEWKYGPPANTYPGFGVLKNPPQERGTLLSQHCEDTTMVGVYADGHFGSYTAVIKTQDPDCGYNPTPPAGTILGTKCQGTDLYNRVADGVGGENLVLKSVNSTVCGYVPPPTPSHTPTKLDAVYSDDTGTVFTNAFLTADMDGSVRSEYAAYSGRWYWEVTVTDTLTHVGIGTKDALTTGYVGETAHSWGWAVQDKQLVHDDHNVARKPLNVTVVPGDVIGVALNFVSETLSFYKNGTLVSEAFTGLTGIYHAMASNSNQAGSEGSSVTFNFGDSGMLYTPPTAHIAGFGVPTTVYTRKGTYYTYSCSGTTRINRYHDGGGGYYTANPEVNSPSCGWKPPTPADTYLRDICVGIALYKQYADGNYGTYNVLVEERSVSCGYKPYGALISSRCEGFDKYSIYSDGEGGQYEQLTESNSVSCGYGAGSGGGSEIPPIDESLEESTQDLLVFTVRPKPNKPGTMIVPLK